MAGSSGYALTVGTVAGVAINTAHELGHKQPKVERTLAKLALAQSGYGHFYVEHNRGHHNRVATPEDPASSRLGESFWAFLPRTVVGSVRSAWGLEAKRLRAQGKSVWSTDNDVLTAWAYTVVLFAGLAIAFGPKVLPFLVVQAVFGFSLLEVVNYLEHYGLLRQTQRAGPLRALQSPALVELEPRGVQRHPLQPGTPLRPPRAPHPPLPGAASLRRVPAAPLRATG